MHAESNAQRRLRFVPVLDCEPVLVPVQERVLQQVMMLVSLLAQRSDLGLQPQPEVELA